jgi:hypothetical protein
MYVVEMLHEEENKAIHGCKKLPKINFEGKSGEECWDLYNATF